MGSDPFSGDKTVNETVPSALRLIMNGAVQIGSVSQMAGRGKGVGPERHELKLPL